MYEHLPSGRLSKPNIGLHTFCEKMLLIVTDRERFVKAKFVGVGTPGLD